MPKTARKTLSQLRDTVTEATLTEATGTLKSQLDRREQEIADLKEQIAGLEDEMLGMSRKLLAYNREKTAMITLPVSGPPAIDLTGPWTNGDFRKIHAVFFAAIRSQQHEERLKRALASPPEMKSADNSTKETF
jgi:hypothetical protein